MSLYVYGDFDVNDCGYPKEIYSIDDACQRVRFILLTKKGSFIYNRNFGADFSPIVNDDCNKEEADKLAGLLCREALAEQKEISVENVTIDVSENSEYRLKLNVLFGGEKKALEVDLN